jgi:hypothetical protein
MKKKKKKNLLRFCRILARSRRNPAGYRRNQCLRGVLGKNNKKWSRAMHLTTVSSVNDGLTDRVPTLKDFETSKGYIVKIEISVAELKIHLNFMRVIRTFPIFISYFYITGMKSFPFHC